MLSRHRQRGRTLAACLLLLLLRCESLPKLFELLRLFLATVGCSSTRTESALQQWHELTLRRHCAVLVELECDGTRNGPPKRVHVASDEVHGRTS